MTILCVGGGTAGSIVPLTSLLEWRKRMNTASSVDRIVWVDTGSDRDARYESRTPQDGHWTLPVSKWRRYWDWRNIISPVIFLVSVLKAVGICAVEKPHVIWTAGSFVCVPVVWAGWLLRIPSIILQQDVRVGLANRLMQPLAAASFSTIPPRSIINARGLYRFLGALTRWSSPSRTIARTEPPLILILGGSSGAASLNAIIWKLFPLLPHNVRVFHSTGSHPIPTESLPSGYRTVESIGPELERYYSQAVIVITRAGMNVLTECAFFAKAIIVVPLPGSHQQENAALLKQNNAAIVVDERGCTPQRLMRVITNLLDHPADRELLGANLHRLFPAATPATLRTVFNVHRSD